MPRRLFAALVAVALTASPAHAADASDWAAPLDDQAGRQVRLFGLVAVPANEGVLDRSLRLAAAAGLGYLAVADPFVAGPALRAGTGAVGAVLGFTAVTGACPAYMPFGLDTRAGGPAAPGGRPE